MTLLRTFRGDQRGGSAVEFALVVPVFLLLVLSVIYLSLTGFAAVQLHNATQGTARCLAVSANNVASAQSATRCPPTWTATDIQTYGFSRYTGPKISPVFTLDGAATCGKKVSGTGTFRLPLGFVNISVPITATSCFPYILGT